MPPEDERRRPVNPSPTAVPRPASTNAAETNLMTIWRWRGVSAPDAAERRPESPEATPSARDSSSSTVSPRCVVCRRVGVELSTLGRCLECIRDASAAWSAQVEAVPRPRPSVALTLLGLRLRARGGVR